MSSRVKINENKIFRHWQDPRWTIGNKPNSYSGCMLAGDIGGWCKLNVTISRLLPKKPLKYLRTQFSKGEINFAILQNDFPLFFTL